MCSYMDIERSIQYRNDKIENAKVDNQNRWEGFRTAPRSCGNVRFGISDTRCLHHAA